MQHIQILEYSPELQPYFEQINKQWVTAFFELEEFDRKQLEHPEETIIAPGGAVIFASDAGKVVGTVALFKVSDDVYEMIKMGVSPEERGKKIGEFLGLGILKKAKAMGGRKVILYSSSKLVPALSLYKKLGFREVPKECGKYGRCDIKMEIDL